MTDELKYKNVEQRWIKGGRREQLGAQIYVSAYYSC
jgi:hypothetical protein